MWRGWSRSAGWRSRRSRSPAASAPARTSHGEARRFTALEVPRVSAGASVERAGRVDARQARPPLERRRERLAQRVGVGVGGSDEAARAHAGEPQDAAAGLDRAPRLVAVEAEELGGRVAAPRRGRRGAVLEAVLGDRVAARRALGQPLHHLGPAVVERVQVGRRDDEQRHALDPVVVEPVADQRAALERRGLDVVQGDGDRARVRGHAASSRRSSSSSAKSRSQRRRQHSAAAAGGSGCAARAAAMAAASPSVSPGAKRVRDVAQQRRARRARAGHDARAAGRRLERDEPEGLVLAGHDHAARAGVRARQARAIGDEGLEGHAPGDAERARAAAQLRPRPGPSRSAAAATGRPSAPRRPAAGRPPSRAPAARRRARGRRARRRSAGGRPRAGPGAAGSSPRARSRARGRRRRRSRRRARRRGAARRGRAPPTGAAARACRRRRARRSRGGRPRPSRPARGRPRSPAAAPRTGRAGARRRGAGARACASAPATPSGTR